MLKFNHKIMNEAEEKEKNLEKIKTEVLNCKKCPLYENRIYPVIGEGNHDTKIMFIGEGPGAQEDRTGRPFCGAAGKILDELLVSVGIKREDVYICNILKCRPPQNRDPNQEEIEACTPYLERQIKIIKPKVICPLGRYSMQFLMEKFGLKDEIQPIGKIHGKVFEVNPFDKLRVNAEHCRSIKNLFGSVKIIPLYHPAVATYNPNMKEILKKDFQILKNLR